MRPFYATPQLHTVHARNDNPGVALAPVDPPAADRQRRDAGPPPRERIVTDRSAAVPRPVETQRDLTPAHHDNAPVTDRPAGALKHPPVVTRHRTDNAPATDEKPKQQGALNSGHLPVLVPADSQRRAHESESARLGAARAESVVHVSIGRVEVRASLPATPPSRTKQRSPMSLEDYLRQRSGAR
ncbi:MAG TPA: hypothetical protein VFI49_14510 [Rudaea sp.]|nr:hypothetical protein [Rudaea sp.]